MSIQVLHEAEHTRQHARYQIPVKLRIEGKTYSLENWSVSGLAINNIKEPKQKYFKAVLIFDFGSFHTLLDVELEKKNFSSDQQALGCVFSNLSKDKLSVLHYIINSYLAGELTTTGSLIEVLKKDRYTKKDMSKVLNPDMTRMQKIALRIKQIFVYISLSAIVFSLLSFIAFSIYNKLYIVKSLSANINAPIVVIRSPQPSYYTAMRHSQNGEVNKGDLLASMKLIGGGANSIESPAQGVIIIEHVLDKSFVDIGEPLLTILPEGASSYIEAKVQVKDAVKLSIGQKANVQLPSGEVIEAHIKEVKTADSITAIHASPLHKAYTSSFDYILVILEPSIALDASHLGHVVSVKINTF